MKFTIQVAPEDCTGCGVCVQHLPGQEQDRTSRNRPQGHQHGPPDPAARAGSGPTTTSSCDLPDTDPDKRSTVRHDQGLASSCRPLFEFSGACAGCGETPYVKLLTQLFGDRLIIANATGCSSIYGGNLPTTPYTHNAPTGAGPAWSNSLFEDNAEFGLGMRLTVDKPGRVRPRAAGRPGRLRERSAAGTWLQAILSADQASQAGHRGAARAAWPSSRRRWPARDAAEARQLLLAGRLPGRKSVWIVGGDGWAYDIGYGGLDHVLASGQERQHAGAGHRGVLQHRRPDVQGHPVGRGGQVRRRRQAAGQEGPGHDRHELRQRLRGPRRHGRQPDTRPSRPSPRPKPTTGPP